MTAWTVPINLGVAKTIKIGKTPVKLKFEVIYYIQQPSLRRHEFLHHAEVITITGRSYRLKDRATQAVQETNQTKKPTKSKETSCEKAKR